MDFKCDELILGKKDADSRALTLRKKKLWGNHFWQRGYFVDSVGANEEIIRRYVKHQDKVAKEEEERQQSLEFTS